MDGRRGHPDFSDAWAGTYLMKVKFEDGFKVALIAETQLERLFMIEWHARSTVNLIDSRDRDCQFIDPGFVTWEVSDEL